MNFEPTAQQKTLQQRCQEFAEREIAPHVALLEDDLAKRMDLFAKMARQGLFQLAVDRQQSDAIGYALALAAIAKADAGIAVAMGVTNMVAETIAQYGSQEQKDHYLPQIKSGALVPCSFALTEKGAGSDAKSIQLKATEQSDGSFVLDGEKQFITNADIAGIIIVFAQTDPAKQGKGITAFIVDRGAAGMTITKKEQKLGLLTANLVDLRFQGCHVAKNRLLGNISDGLAIALHSLDSGRIGIAAQAVGIAEAAFEAARHYAKTREQFGKPIANNQAIAFKLADMQVNIEAGTLLLLKACWLKEQGKPYNSEASTAKLFCSEACNQIADDALQIHGGYGYVKGLPPEKLFRDARATTIYEGTSEIQRIIIAKTLLSKD